MLSVALAETVTVPESETPLTGAVMETVGGVVSGGVVPAPDNGMVSIAPLEIDNLPEADPAADGANLTEKTALPLTASVAGNDGVVASAKPVPLTDAAEIVAVAEPAFVIVIFMLLLWPTVVFGKTRLVGFAVSAGDPATAGAKTTST